ncbi:MAG: WYL domain-containing protein [Ruminococcaceae bacterium]|nr:WYL domain-containing protein [Oscillospiraceae bacterium]
MPKKPHQKQKLLHLLDILQRETDEEHPLTLEQLRQALAARGIEAERKSLYDDLEQLRLYGADVLTVRDRTVRYYIGARDFDLPELRLLVDAVQSSRFITVRKSRDLIGKLETLCSRHQAVLLQRQLLVTGRIKTMNESIYYNVDALQEAVAADRQITFQYFEWTMGKERHLRREGARYLVSPWALTWDDENYYLIGYEEDRQMIRHYRVDRMLHIEVTDHPRKGAEAFEALDTAVYARKTFGMFSGQEVPVALHCAPWMAGVIIDRFGQDVIMYPDGDGFRVRVPVTVSPLFFAWLAGFGADVTVLEPADVAEEYRNHLRTILASYDVGEV